MPKSQRRGVVSLALLTALAGVTGVATVAWNKLFRHEQPVFKDAAEQFKYGSIGNMESQGMPYYLWLVLPRVFGEYLPGNGGYTSLGFVWEPGHETPVGFAKETIGFPRIAFNCALCHAASVRADASATPQVFPAGPAHQADTQAYLDFLFQAASDARFDPDVLLPVIEQTVPLSFVDKALYRYVLIPVTKKTLLEQKQNAAWMATRPKWGPGRIDPFNPVKYGFLGIAPDDTIGNSDNMPIWDLESRKHHRLHWDGMNDSIREVVLSSAFGDGASLKSLEPEKLKALEDWLVAVDAPKYEGAIDRELASTGEPIFQRLCADCHAEDGKRVAAPIPLDEVGTDPQRHRLWTAESAQRYNDYAKGYAFDFSRWVATNGPRDGYSPTPLQGLWLRGPYLHNGSVPSLEDLLNEPYASPPSELLDVPTELAGMRRLELRKHQDSLQRVEQLVKTARAEGRRPAAFFRGLDVFDAQHVGFVSDVASPPEQAQPFLYDTRVVGNSNRGHSGARYGTTLAAADKRALIEFLKTL